MKVLTDNKYYSEIANVIREQNGTNNTYKPQQIVNALKDLFYEEVEGVPPLNFQGIGEKLLDYRIYGASGGVGDRTDNLFSSDISDGYHLDSITGLPVPSQTRCATIEPIPINSNNLILTFKSNVVATKFMYSLFSGNTLIRRVANLSSGVTIDTSNADKIYFAFYRTDSSSAVLSVNNLNNIMLSTLNADYEPYGYKIPIVVSGKNLLPTPEVKSQTVNGVTISRFVNGIITIKGTPTAQMDVKFNFEESTFSAGSYIHLRNNFPTYNFAVSFRKDGVNKIAPGLGTLNSIKQITEDITVNQMVVLCNNNAVGTNYDIIIQPSIELTNEETSYEPYHEPTTANIYLDEPIEENESISLSDTNVNIPTIRGTNVLTVDTTVQPDKVYVKSRHESSHEAQIRQLYESVNAELTQYKAQYGELGGE